MKILLIVPKLASTAFGFTNFPVGLAYISSSLKKAGYDVHVMDFNKYYCGFFNIALIQMLIKRKVMEIEPQVVGTGGLSAIFDQLKLVIDTVKEVNPGITTVVGGGCLSSEPEVVMENMAADFGVIGEGEETIVDLVAALDSQSQDFSSVDGIIYKGEKGLTKTKPRKPIDDLDALPFPDYEGFDISGFLDRQTLTDKDVHPNNHPRAIEIAASRSCPFQCTFCFHPVGDKYRKRSIESVISEIKYLQTNYNINYLTMNDELFATNKEWLKEFCKEIKKIGIKWQAQLRVDSVDEDLIVQLKDAGCIYISYGLESASPPILKSMRKKISIDQISKALEITRRHDLTIQGNFIFGDKDETIETMVETLDWWFKHKDYRIALSRIVPYPGSALYKYAIEQGMLTEDRVEYLKNGCKKLQQLNLTRIPNEIFNSLMQIVMGHLRPGNFSPGKVNECRLEGCDPYQGYFYSVNVECPYCGKEADYKYIHSKYIKFAFRTYNEFNFGCRECNQRMTFMPPEVENLMIDIVHNQKKKKIAVMGVDRKAQLLMNTSYLAKQHIVVVLEEPEKYPDALLNEIPVRSIHEPDCSVEFDCVIKLSKLDPSYDNACQQLAAKGCPVYDLSDTFLFLDMPADDAQVQVYFNYVAQQIDKAKQNGFLDEANYILIDLLERFPATLDIHRNLLEVSAGRKDFSMFFDVAYTLAFILAPEHFEPIKQFLIQIFNKLIEEGNQEKAGCIVDILLFKNPQEDPNLIQSMRDKLGHTTIPFESSIQITNEQAGIL